MRNKSTVNSLNREHESRRAWYLRDDEKSYIYETSRRVQRIRDYEPYFSVFLSRFNFVEFMKLINLSFRGTVITLIFFSPRQMTLTNGR